MTRTEEINQQAEEYRQPYRDGGYRLSSKDVRDAFEEGAEWADTTNALELFKKLPHLDYLYGVQTDWKYAPNLYHFDGAWHVSWVECEEGDTIKDFEAETPEEAIKKAFDWCVELKVIKK